MGQSRIPMLMNEQISKCKKARKAKMGRSLGALQAFGKHSNHRNEEGKTTVLRKGLTRKLLGSGRRQVIEVMTARSTLTDQKSIAEEFSEYFTTLAGALD